MTPEKCVEKNDDVHCLLCSDALKALSVKLSSPFKSSDSSASSSVAASHVSDTRREESFTVHLGSSFTRYMSSLM